MALISVDHLVSRCGRCSTPRRNRATTRRRCGRASTRAVASVDDALALAEDATRLPVRDDWPYDEPDDLDGIAGPPTPTRPRALGADHARRRHGRARAGFLGSVCGCMLGKPVEIDPTLDELRAALDRARRVAARRLHHRAADDRGGLRTINRVARARCASGSPTSRPTTTSTTPCSACSCSSEHGVDFTRRQLARCGCDNLVPACTYGPERTVLGPADAWPASRGHGDRPSTRSPTSSTPATSCAAR